MCQGLGGAHTTHISSDGQSIVHGKGFRQVKPLLRKESITSLIYLSRGKSMGILLAPGQHYLQSFRMWMVRRSVTRRWYNGH